MKRLENHLRTFEHSYGMLVKVMGALVAIITLYYIYDQIKISTEQSEAAWFANRPFLFSHIKTSPDVRGFEGSVWVFGKDTVDRKELSTLQYKIRSIGHSPAKLDSIKYTQRTDTLVLDSMLRYEDTELGPSEIHNFTTPFPILNSRLTFIGIEIFYTWTNPDPDDDVFRTKRIYQVMKIDSNWRASQISKHLYDEKYRTEQ